MNGIELFLTSSFVNNSCRSIYLTIYSSYIFQCTNLQSKPPEIHNLPCSVLTNQNELTMLLCPWSNSQVHSSPILYSLISPSWSQAPSTPSWRLNFISSISSKWGYYVLARISPTNMPSLRISKEQRCCPAPTNNKFLRSFSQLLRLCIASFLNNLTEECKRRSHMRMVLSQLEVKKRCWSQGDIEMMDFWWTCLRETYPFWSVYGQMIQPSCCF